MKVACVLITHLPVKAEVQRNGALIDKPVLITTQSSEGMLVLDVSQKAKGVSPGMPLQVALSRCKGAVLIEADDAYYHQVFDRIVEALFDKSPLVEKGDLGCTFLDMHGTERMYGGDEGIIDALQEAAPPDFGPRVGLAKSKFLAYLAAVMSKPGQATTVPTDVAGFLKELPVDLLPLSWEERTRLHDFGLLTMGQIASLSVGSLQAQFGPQGRVAWELANGIDKSPLVSSKRREAVTDFLRFRSLPPRCSPSCQLWSCFWAGYWRTHRWRASTSAPSLSRRTSSTGRPGRRSWSSRAPSTGRKRPSSC